MIKETPVIITKSVKGKVGCTLPKLDVPQLELTDFLSESLIRLKKANLPEISEPEVMRHFVNLSTKNHHIDKDIFPLGSCTMKYNPKINEHIASLGQYSSAHPNTSDKYCQSSITIVYELEQMLKKITGMSAFTLQPSAGSQGEFIGLLLMRKYHELNNNDKNVILIPESAHGTNPASVILAGYKPVELGTDERGRVDMEDLKSKINKDVAGMMLTQPNTLGLFEDQISEISELIHNVDGLMYMDGANLNALIGLSKPADMGFDITHINVHKTFSTPHGGGGPGAGPIGVVDKLKEMLPYPLARKNKNEYFWDFNIKNSIGKIHSYNGNFGILLRAFVYIKMLGEEGVKDMTKHAILNANYIKKSISSIYDVPFSNGTLHEFVISALKQKNKGVKALDIAKSILDYGFYAPTIYFPTNIPESIMIEPTESEDKDTLDRFISAMLEIDKNIDLDKDRIINAPFNTPVGRLDETKANRELNLRWNIDEL
jgi:glycine dehydrogenase subunit 2